jgi:hypothetical protein
MSALSARWHESARKASAGAGATRSSWGARGKWSTLWRRTRAAPRCVTPASLSTLRDSVPLLLHNSAPQSAQHRPVRRPVLTFAALLRSKVDEVAAVQAPGLYICVPNDFAFPQKCVDKARPARPIASPFSNFLIVVFERMLLSVPPAPAAPRPDSAPWNMLQDAASFTACWFQPDLTALRAGRCGSSQPPRPAERPSRSASSRR